MADWRNDETHHAEETKRALGFPETLSEKAPEARLRQVFPRLTC
jgi:hypothetical protein